MPDREQMPYRDCAGVMLLNASGQVFIGARLDKGKGPDGVEMTKAWQMPQGGIDAGEEPFAAAQRELLEETNVTSTHLLAEAPDWVHYDLPDAVLGKALKGKFRGQRQKWFAMLFDGDESEINISNPDDGRHPPEFGEWRWESLDQLAGLIVPFKRPVYEQLVTWFADLPAQIRAKAQASGE